MASVMMTVEVMTVLMPVIVILAIYLRYDDYSDDFDDDDFTGVLPGVMTVDAMTNKPCDGYSDDSLNMMTLNMMTLLLQLDISLMG